MGRSSLFTCCLVAALAAGCSRSVLPGPGASAASTGGAGGSAAIGGNGGATTTTTTTGSDAGPDAPPPPPLPCTLVAAGPAIDIIAFPDRHATAPSAVAFGPSDIGVQTFASGGDSFLHDDIQLARFSMADPWPGGLVTTTLPQLFGIESHGWANLVLAPSHTALALTWHGDPGGLGRPMFRLWDIASWSPKAPLDIVFQGEAVLDTAPGAGTGSLGVGYAGQGFGVVWRDVEPGGGTRPVAAVLDAEGQGVLGPKPVAAFNEYPGPSPAIVWTGATYLMATSFNACAPGDMLCAPLSVVVTRIRPASGDFVDDSGIDLVATIPAHASSSVITRAALAHHDGHTYLAWAEGKQTDLGSPRNIFVAELTPKGEVMSGPTAFEQGAPMQSRVTLVASDLGVSATWVEDGDTTIDNGAIGRSLIVTTHLGSDLDVFSSRVTVPATRWDSYGPPKATALAAPRSLFVVWSGQRKVGVGYEDVWAARLDCAN